MKKATKIFAYSKIDMLMCRDDRNGERHPFFLRYITKSGEIIEEDNVICTSVDRQRATHRIKLLNTTDPTTKNAMTRTVRDCLILQIDEYRIVKS